MLVTLNKLKIMCVCVCVVKLLCMSPVGIEVSLYICRFDQARRAADSRSEILCYQVCDSGMFLMLQMMSSLNQVELKSCCDF